VLARYNEDGQWKEAAIRRAVQGGAKYLVLFKKYNKSEVVQRSDIVELGQRTRNNGLRPFEEAGGWRSPAPADRYSRGASPGRTDMAAAAPRSSPARHLPGSPHCTTSPKDDPLLQVLEVELKRSAALRNSSVGSPDRRPPPGWRTSSGGAQTSASVEVVLHEPPGQHHLDDLAMQRFIVEGFVSVGTGGSLQQSFHDKIQAKCTSLQMHTNTHNMGNNVLAAIPEIADVFELENVRGVLESILGKNYLMHGYRACLSSGKNGSQQEPWRRDVHSNTFQRREHRPRWVTALYYPQATTVELGLTDFLAGSQFCTIFDHRAQLHHARSTDGAVTDILDLDGLHPVAWGKCRSLAMAAGTVVIMHHDLWHRQMNSVSGVTNGYVFKLHFARMQEPVPGAPQTWQHNSTEWLLPAENPGVPNLRIVWESVWRWYCGAQGDGDDSESCSEQTVQTLVRRLGWDAGDNSPASTPAQGTPAASDAWPPERHTGDVRDALAKAQSDHVHAQGRIEEYQAMVDNLLLQVSGTGGALGRRGAFDSELLERELQKRQKEAVGQIMSMQSQIQRQAEALQEQKSKESREKERTKVAKAEAIKLRRDLSNAETGTKKLSRKFDQSREKHLQLQNRLTTVATAARQGKAWNPSWDKWVPGLDVIEDDGPSKDPWAKRYLAAKEAYSPAPSSGEMLGAPGEAATKDGLSGWGDDKDDSFERFNTNGNSFGEFSGLSDQNAPQMANTELEMNLQIKAGVDQRLDELTENLRMVALSALARGRFQRLQTALFKAWENWSTYKAYRKAVGTRAIKRMRRERRKLVWRAWMGWAAAKQMEERIEEIYEQAKADAGGDGNAVDRSAQQVKSPIADTQAANRDAANATESTPNDLVLSRLMVDADQELKSIQAAYNLAGLGVDGARALVTVLLSTEQASSTLHACVARNATHGLTAVSGHVFSEILPLLVAALLQCGTAAGREAAAFVLGEAGLRSARSDAVTGLVDALVGRNGAGNTQDDCELVRAAAADALANIAVAILSDGASIHEELVDRIVSTFTIVLHTEVSDKVLLASVMGLARLGQAAEPAMTVLVDHAKRSGDKYVRYVSLEALRRLDNAEANSILVSKLLTIQRWCSLTNAFNRH
jgi:hypothetical protein